MFGFQTHSRPLSSPPTRPAEKTLYFPPLLPSFFPGSSSWLRSGAVPNCCDLMGGNLLDSCTNLLGEVNLIKIIILTSLCRLQQMPKKGAGLLSLSTSSFLWGSQLANEKKPDCKALPFPSLITYSIKTQHGDQVLPV